MKSALRILIVEDDRAIARVLRDHLVFEGFDVECVGDGRAVLARVHSFLPHLILLDLTLPGDDGFEVCRAVTQLLDPPSIIMLTARGQHEDKVRGLRLGADDCVTKPFKFDELLARVHAVLRRAHPPADQLVLTDGMVVDFRRQGGRNIQCHPAATLRAWTPIATRWSSSARARSWTA